MGKVIYFSHSGFEHLTKNIYGYSIKEFKAVKKLDEGIMPWNTADKHARKFIHSDGDYIDCSGNSGNARIAFWGEWEQQSSFKKTKGTSPVRIHRPICERTEIIESIESGKPFDEEFIIKCLEFYERKQNTDPYVFGDAFYYSCCQQTITNRKTKKQVPHKTLIDLEPGDMILFVSVKAKESEKEESVKVKEAKKEGSEKGEKGERKKGIVVLDTVFVVGGTVLPKKKVYRDELENLRDKVSPQYLGGVILPICFGNRGSLSEEPSVYTLYRAAMYNDNEKPKNEMFSFFPCKKAESGKGFERYVLYDKETGEGLGRTVNAQGIVKGKKDEKDGDSYSFWKMLKQDILDKGYLLGVKANEPEFTEVNADAVK